MQLSEITIRPIKQTDNIALAKIVRDTLAEFGANKQGTVFFDPTTDALFELFNVKGAIYFVAENNNKILGGGGIYPTVGLPADTCELVKMYLLPHARGIGLGKKLIENCIDSAKSIGYKRIYLETLEELHLALKIYAKFGFEYLSAPLGDSKHFGCGLWMLKEF